MPNSSRIAIIGAGISGLAAARYLKEVGFNPQIFESHTEFGGQWAITNPRSGIWPSMRTNTPNFLTKLSGANFPAGTSLFPHNRQVWEMLADFVRKFELAPLITFGAEIVELAEAEGGYKLTWRQNGQELSEFFPRVIIASGRFNQPAFPNIPGLDSFTGEIIHAFNYEGIDKFRSRRVCVLGSNTSAMEITSDLAMSNQVEVTLSRRRQRYVMPKIVNGRPIEFANASLQDLLAAENLSERELIAKTEGFVKATVGDPSDFGLPRADSDFAKAGVTSSPYILNLAAENRFKSRPAIAAIAGDIVEFADHTSDSFDALIFCTGYEYSIPFLSPEIQEKIGYDKNGIDLANFTFHPQLPGLAFAGFWNLTGAYPVAIEQQARYIAYSWAKIIEQSEIDISAALVEAKRERINPKFRIGNHLAYRFAKLIGVTPDLLAHPTISEQLLATPPTAAIFKIDGPGAESKYQEPASWLAISEE